MQDRSVSNVGILNKVEGWQKSWWYIGGAWRASHMEAYCISGFARTITIGVLISNYVCVLIFYTYLILYFLANLLVLKKRDLY